jgi:hypothetical protein
MDAWQTIVEMYSARKLTFPADILAAIAADATRYGERWVSDIYSAGIWHKTFLYELIWAIEYRPLETQSRRILEVGIPSWSWASVTGPVPPHRYR